MRLLWLLLFCLIFVSPAEKAFAEHRVALIIGNANYPSADAPLKEPGKDARALADELKKSTVGFEVDVAENLSKEAMRKAFDRFYAKIRPDTTALVFFSGFAIQSARQSYLIPVDGQVWAEADVRRDGVSLDAILREMNSRGAKVKIAILDASRRNPFERRFRPVSGGLAPVEAPTGSLVMFSAAPSNVVNEDGNENRMFVNELVNQIRSQELTAEEAFNRTRMAVTRGTQGQQVPWVSSSLITDFYFPLSPKVAIALPAPARPTSSPPSSPPSSRPSSSPSPPSSTSDLAAPPAPRPMIPKMDPVEPTPESKPIPPVASLPPAVTPAPPASSPPPPPGPMSREDSNAIQDLNRRLRADPNDANALYRRGQLFAKNDDYSRALSDFDATIRLRPRDSEALNNRCWVRAIIGDLYAALQDCDASLQIKPDSVDSLDSRGFVKLKLGQPQNAIADYDASLRLSARKASSLYGRGIAKLRIGDRSGDADISDAKSIEPSVADEFNRYGVR